MSKISPKFISFRPTWSQFRKGEVEIGFEHWILRSRCDFEKACPWSGWKNKTVTYQKGKMGVRDLEITLVEVPSGTVRAKGSLWSSQRDE